MEDLNKLKAKAFDLIALKEKHQIEIDYLINEIKKIVIEIEKMELNKDGDK